MDPRCFDTLVKSLSTSGTRRGLLTLLAALPLAGSLTVLLAADGDAAGRRKRRKKRHKHQQGDDKENRKGKRKGKDKGKKKCTPESAAQTCGGQSCGTAVNNCGRLLNCTGCTGCCDGATCQSGMTPGACGSGGNACLPCSGTTPLCVGGSCTACSATNQCPSCLSCSSGACVTDAAQDEACCGTPNGGTWCQSGACVTPSGSFADCQDRCDAAVAICGPAVTCPDCGDCPCAPPVGAGVTTCTGPSGFGKYCTQSGGNLCIGGPGGTCPGGSICCGVNCHTTCTT